MAEESIHRSVPPQRNDGFGSEFKKLVPQLVFAGLVGLLTSWWSNSTALQETRYRQDRIEERQREFGVALADTSKLCQNNTTRIAEMTIINQNLVDMVRDMRKK